MKILVGSTYPLSLIRSKVVINPKRKEDFSALCEQDNIELYSFWGHDNTLQAAKQLFGIDLSPLHKRPSVILSENKLPMLFGKEFNECWVVSPDYASGFRPEIGKEVRAEQIIDWFILKLKWETECKIK